MTTVTFTSIPSGAEVELDGEYVGTTPCDVEIGEVSNIDMAIFVSPQYKNDTEILSSIQVYADAVKDDIGWNVEIVKIDLVQNQYASIASIIGSMNTNHPLKACMMVGEDIDTAISFAGPTYMVPCTAPWYLVGGASTYALNGYGHVVDAPAYINIPTSLMYPSCNDSYQTKKQQMISTFYKFSINRNADYGNDIIFLHDEEFRCNYQTYPPDIGDVTCITNPNIGEIEQSINTEYKMFCVNGHGTPHTVNLVNSVFYAHEHARIANTPFMAFTACKTHGWWTNSEVTTTSLPPYNIRPYGWFGHSIFDNQYLRVMTTGSTSGYALLRLDKKLAAGYTLAEAMKGTLASTGWNVVYGDITFHYRNR